ERPQSYSALVARVEAGNLHREFFRNRKRPHPPFGGLEMPKTKESLQKLYVEQLKDLYSAEEQILEALPKMISMTAHAELKRGFQQHYQQTEQQVQRLQTIFADLDESSGGHECE